jgi:hypothetical protein
MVDGVAQRRANFTSRPKGVIGDFVEAANGMKAPPAIFVIAQVSEYTPSMQEVAPQKRMVD